MELSQAISPPSYTLANRGFCQHPSCCQLHDHGEMTRTASSQSAVFVLGVVGESRGARQTPPNLRGQPATPAADRERIATQPAHLGDEPVEHQRIRLGRNCLWCSALYWLLPALISARLGFRRSSRPTRRHISTNPCLRGNTSLPHGESLLTIDGVPRCGT